MGAGGQVRGRPPRRGVRGGGVLLGEQEGGGPVNDSLRVHDTLKAGDVVAEPLSGASRGTLAAGDAKHFYSVGIRRCCIFPDNPS